MTAEELEEMTTLLKLYRPNASRYVDRYVEEALADMKALGDTHDNLLQVLRNMHTMYEDAHCDGPQGIIIFKNFLLLVNHLQEAASISRIRNSYPVQM